MRILKVFGLTLYIVGVSIMMSCIDFSQYSKNFMYIAIVATVIGGTIWGNIEGRE